ncbi:MAG TPA: right-handed parallel beta-helix repeat-containing protein, partial [Candidatus Absconditabacterales bacterium]|nr:right-handed parallel beta-helix repeat-containing protein [Candidatus Absconditabacterales bacterium]
MKRKSIYVCIVLFLSATIFLSTTTSATLVSETKIWQTTDSTGDPDIADPNPAKNVYIDSSYTGSPRNGTINQPYNTRAEVPQGYGSSPQNKTYLFKRGTTNYGSIAFLNKENINIGAYGVGTRPKLIYTGNSYAVAIRFYGNPTLQQTSRTRIVGMDISANKNAAALVRFTSNTSIENCYLHNAGWGIRSTGDPLGSPSAIQNIQLKNSVIEDIADDGMYIVSVSGVVIEDNLIWKVNQNYFLVGHSQTQAAGDGIQFVHVANRVVRNNRIDRSDTPNKFGFIFALDDTPVGSTAKIEGNTFIAPKGSSQGGSTIYGAIASGANLLMQNNVFSGSVSLPGYNQTCIWYNGKNLTSRNNIYKNMNRCLTNKFFQNGVPQVPIYSQGDTFIGCNYNTEGNVIISSGTTTNNPPVIANQLFALFKNDPNGTFVGNVLASDPDNGQTLTYTIIGGNTNNAFSINAVGRIIVNDSYALQNFTSPFYTLTVRVQDNGSPSLYADAQIKVVVDSTPLIYTQSFSVHKYSTNGTVIGHVVAENPYNSSPLSYTIIGGNT